MKKYLKFIINIINKIFLLSNKTVVSVKSAYLVRVKIQDGNIVDMSDSDISKSFIEVYGSSNSIKIHNSFLENLHINIQGKNNHLIVYNNVKLRNTTFHLKGENCIIKIGENTTVGGARIVNIGDSNNIIIGENCLLADNIEIWASDSHKIYDSDKNCINKEKPIYIGNKVWIGSHVKILKGVTIGHNAIIGMSSLITKDVHNGDLCAGNPPKKIKSNVIWTL